MERYGIVCGALPRDIRQQISEMDLLIAATALAFGPTLVAATSKIPSTWPGLALYQP